MLLPQLEIIESTSQVTDPQDIKKKPTQQQKKKNQNQSTHRPISTEGLKRGFVGLLAKLA